jgi:hypothetical protein
METAVVLLQNKLETLQDKEHEAGNNVGRVCGSVSSERYGAVKKAKGWKQLRFLSECYAWLTLARYKPTT